MRVLLGSRLRRSLVAGLVIAASVLGGLTAALPADAQPPGYLGDQQILSPGQYLQSPNGSYRLVYDQTGHLILIRVSDDKHCASWPSPSTSVPRPISYAYYNATNEALYLVNEVNARAHIYYTVNGSTAQGGNTVNVNNAGVFYIGYHAVHGC